MEHEAFVTTVLSVVALLFVAAVSAVITKRIHFPYTVGLVVIGVALAYIADDYPHLAHALDELKLEPVMIMLDMLTETYEGFGAVMLERMADQLVLDAKLDTLEELERIGELPEHLAAKLREELEAA